MEKSHVANSHDRLTRVTHNNNNNNNCNKKVAAVQIHSNHNLITTSHPVAIRSTLRSTFDDDSLTSGAGSSFGSSSSTNTGSTIISNKGSNKNSSNNNHGKKNYRREKKTAGEQGSSGTSRISGEVSSDSSGEGSCESDSDISSSNEASCGSDDDDDSRGNGDDDDDIPSSNNQSRKATRKVHDVQDNLLMITEPSAASAIDILAQAVDRIKTHTSSCSPPSSTKPGSLHAAIEVNRLGRDGCEPYDEAFLDGHFRRATIVLARPPTLPGHVRRGTNNGRGVWPPPMYGTRGRTSSSSCSSSSVDNVCYMSPKSYNFSYRRQSMPHGHKDQKYLTKKLNKEPSKKIILFCLSLVNLTAYLTMSIIAPFFPYEASQKGMRESAAGFVFSVYALVMMIASPLLGKVLPVIGVKFMLLSGIWFAGWSNIIFGFLDYIDDPLAFSVLCFVVRSVGAFGAASFSTASYTYIIQLFPDNVGLAFGLTETCVGIGMSLGPAVGGLLYGLGGYSLPFYVLGSFVLATGPLCAYFVTSIEAPEIDSSEYYESQSSGSSGDTVNPKMTSTYWNVICVPKVAVICLVLATATSTQGFLDPTIEPHFRKYGIEPQYVGLVFLTMSAAYAVSSPISGWFAGKIHNKSPLMVIGLIVTAIGYLILGPSTFLGLEPSFWLSSVAMLILGLAYSLAFIPTFETILDAAVSRGLPDDVTTYSLVSGLWSCVNSFGEVAGAGLGGIFTEYYGFTFGADCIASWTLIVALILLLSYLVELLFPRCCYAHKKRGSLMEEEEELVVSFSCYDGELKKQKEKDFLQTIP